MAENQDLENNNKETLSDLEAKKLQVSHENKKVYNDIQQERLKNYLKFQYETGASDLHIAPLFKPKLRINGELEDIDTDIYTKEDCLALSKELLRGNFQKFVETKSADFTYISEELPSHRFRVHIMFDSMGVSFIIRKIENHILSMKELHLPEQIEKLMTKKSGLILITGSTGSGKSTTMASFINEINKTQKCHILTIEDPIEYIYKSDKALVRQRSVGQDTPSFAQGLRDALREDPDIIVVGEVRDKETAEMLLHAAETGHLVITTLHTTTAPESIQRIVGMFPSSEQERIRFMLSGLLEGVITQKLIVTKEQKRLPIVELLFKTPRITGFIKSNRDDEIEAALEEGKNVYGTQTFDEHLYRLIKQGLVDEKKALEVSTSPGNLQLKIKKIGSQKTEEEMTPEEREAKKQEEKYSFDLNNKESIKQNNGKAPISFGIKEK